MKRRARRVVMGAAALGAGLVVLLAVSVVAIVLQGLFDRDLPRPFWMVSRSDQDIIKSQCKLEAAEVVRCFFALDFFSDLEDGALVTDRRVVKYSNIEDHRTIEQARFEDIADIRFDEQHDWYRQAKLLITRKDGTQFYVLLLKTRDSHRGFFERIMKEWKRDRG